MAKQQKEVERWITVNGARVPIFKDGSVGGPKALQDKIKKNNEKKALTKTQKAEAYWKDNERRLKEGVKTKYHGENHSKLSQHSDIQKIAEEHVEKIWNGGAKTQELYDKVEEWAKKNNVDPVKAKEAAFKAMSEKYADSLKLQKEGKDPLQNIKKKTVSTNSDNKIKPYTVYQPTKMLGEEIHSRLEVNYAKSKEEAIAQYKKKYPKAKDENISVEESKAPEHKKKAEQINKDFDTKEKQIKQNEAERDKLNGKDDYQKGTKVNVRSDYGEDLGERTIVRKLKDNEIPGSFNKNAPGGYYEVENTREGSMFKGEKSVVWAGKISNIEPKEGNKTSSKSEKISLTPKQEKAIKITKDKFTFENGYAELAENELTKYGISLEKMIKVWNQTDSKYSYELKVEKTPGNMFTYGLPTIHYRAYRKKK